MVASPSGSLAAALEAKGYRLTRQRRILLELLSLAPNHLTASQILLQARERDAAINRATVYRTLSLLKMEGLIDELDLLHLEGGEHYYERRRSHDHIHLGCVACGTITELETDLVNDIEKEIRRRTGYRTEAVRIEVRALCPDCLTNEDSTD